MGNQRHVRARCKERAAWIPLHGRLLHDGHRPVVVAVPGVRVMQVIADEEVDVTVVQEGGVAASGSVSMLVRLVGQVIHGRQRRVARPWMPSR